MSQAPLAPADLIGQQSVVAPLLEAAARDRLHHCYLFEGPPGVGKATAALGLAQAAACEAPPERRPCRECPTCRQFEKGVHPDLIMVEPDPERATRTISVAQAREVVRVVGLRRYNARRRTVIIDPADSLMPQAANALLKTLEEPPGGTGFILVTARVTSLLPTVRSRSQRVRFRAVPEAELVPWLDGRGIEDAARVARRSRGSPGHALALAAGGLAIQDAIRADMLSAIDGDQAARETYAENLAKGGRAESGERLDALLEVLEGLVRDAVLFAGGRPEALLNADLPDEVERWSRALWPGGAARLQAEIDGARVRAALNVNTRLLIETLLTRVARELGAA